MFLDFIIKIMIILFKAAEIIELKIIQYSIFNIQFYCWLKKNVELEHYTFLKFASIVVLTPSVLVYCCVYINTVK